MQSVEHRVRNVEPVTGQKVVDTRPASEGCGRTAQKYTKALPKAVFRIQNVRDKVKQRDRPGDVHPEKLGSNQTRRENASCK